MNLQTDKKNKLKCLSMLFFPCTIWEGGPFQSYLGDNNGLVYLKSTHPLWILVYEIWSLLLSLGEYECKK